MLTPNAANPAQILAICVVAGRAPFNILNGMMGIAEGLRHGFMASTVAALIAVTASLFANAKNLRSTH